MLTRLWAVSLLLPACGGDAATPRAPGCDELPPGSADWGQWGRDGAHGGASCAVGQRLRRALTEMTYDPFTELEQADANGSLVVHYQVPLVAGDDVYMMAKSGSYTPCTVDEEGVRQCEVHRHASQIWSEVGYRWQGDALTEVWRFESDWKPVPGLRWEPMFQPALAGTRILVPGAGGTLFVLARDSGSLIARVSPFGEAIDPDTYVAGGVAVAADGTAYYNAMKLDHAAPHETAAASWLVAVAPDGSAKTVAYADLIPEAPAADALCFGTFDSETDSLPWPPAAAADGTPTLPVQKPCGAQRPGVNAVPAVLADGGIAVVTRAHFNDRYGFVAVLDPALTLRWATSLRALLADGCGITIPSDGTDSANRDHCRAGTRQGVEPATNQPPAARVIDISSSSPVALPDGGVLYGSYSNYNGARGHLLKFDAGGEHVATYDFGWDLTPAIWQVDPLDPDDYRIIIKDNHYGVDPDTGVDRGPFFITQLDAAFNVVWKFKNSETKSCIRQGDERVCLDDHPNGFEWCVNAPAVDRDGVVYANAEDGYAYAIGPDGDMRERMFLDRSLGAAYTPIALDPKGRVYAMNNGRLMVLGSR